MADSDRSTLLRPAAAITAPQGTLIAMKSVTYFLFLTLTIVQLSSCQRKAPFDPGLSGSFFPLRTGSTWTYRVIDKRQSSVEIFTDRTVGLAHVGSANDSGGLVLEDSNSDGKDNFTISYTVENGYITRSFRFGDPERILFKERRFLPRLLEPDLTWSNSYFPFGRFPEAFHLTETHRTFLETAVVQVPAGAFSDCIRVETETLYEANSHDLYHAHDSRRLRYLDWYAPNVGLIKTLLLESGFFGKEIARVELLGFGDSQNSYNLKKAASHASSAK
jgi:hypothetical protein